MHFSQETLPTTFLDSAVIATTRASSKLNPAELRTKKDRGISCNVKLPVCESIMTSMRTRLWEGRSWFEADMTPRVIYVGCMWAFEFSARLSEYTQHEPGAEDHCVRTDDFSFTVETNHKTIPAVGSALSGFNFAQRRDSSAPKVLECRMLATSSNGKVSVNANY